MAETVPRRPNRLVLVALSLGFTALILAASEFVSGLLLTPHRLTREDFEAATRAIQGDYVSMTLKVLDLVRADPELAASLNPAPSAPDPDLLWRNQSLARQTQPVNPRPLGRNDTWTVHNDARGFRLPEPDLRRKPAGAFRILCVGDSITFGFNVDEGSDYPSQLARLLRARYPGKLFEVVNAGVPGWTWRQGQRFLEIEGSTLEPDVVVIGHGTNDQFFPAQITDVERLGPLYSRPRSLWRHFLAGVAESNTARLLARLLPQPSQALQASPGCQAQVRERGGCRRVSLAEIEDAIDQLRAFTAAREIGLILLNVDFLHTPAVDAARDAARRNGIPLLDMVARFDELRAADEAARAARLGLLPASHDEGSSAPRDVVLRVAAPTPGAVSVKGSALTGGDFAFEQPLFDDGTHGDELADDGVWTTTLRAPPEISVLAYAYSLDGVREFEPLFPLPSTLNVRTLRTDGNIRGPVEQLGALFLMVEQTHPDAAGQRRIAEEVAAALPSLPGFAHFVQAVARGVAPSPPHGHM